MNNTVFHTISSLADGSMSKVVNEEQRRENRRRYLLSNGLKLEQTVLVHLKYEGNDYCRYATADRSNAGDGMVNDSSFIVDALFTKDKDLALFLPVADCVGVVLYDKTKSVLGLAHFGRHNLIQYGGTKAVHYMQQVFSSNPTDVKVWLSPAAGRVNYPLHDFKNRSLHEVTLKQLTTAGVLRENIEIDVRDTTTDTSFFSHSEFLKGNRATDGRQAVVAVMRP